MNAIAGRSFALKCAMTILVLACTGCGGGSQQAPLPSASLAAPGMAPQAVSRTEAAYPSGTPWAIPGEIDFDNYDTGGEGVGYHTTVTTNQGGQYRHDGVSIASAVNAPGGNGYYVGWNDAGDWYHYTVSVQSSATYGVGIVFDSGTTGSAEGTFHIEDKTGKNLTGEISVPATGSWNSNWKALKTSVALSAGANVLKVVIDSGQGLFNLNFMNFVTAPTPTVTPTAAVSPG
jgi:hypothetical protein